MPSTVPTATEARALGSLVGIAIAFGMTDLHRHNVIWQGWRCQVLDLESLFWDVRTLSDIGFIVGKGSEKQSAIEPFLEILKENPEQRSGLVAAFVSGVFEIIVDIKADFDLWSRELSNHSSDRIRVLLRPTANYREENRLEFSPEEAFQFNIGDIPYFAAKSVDLRNGNIEYFDGARWNYVLSLPMSARLDVSRAGRALSELLADDRLAKCAAVIISQLINRAGSVDIEVIHGPFKLRATQSELLIAVGHSRGRVGLK